MGNTSTARNHFAVLDSYRGLCACLVAISHFHANSIFLDSSIFSRGAIWVDFFFVLSGFVIFANYKDKLQSGYSLGKFVFLRFARLYPLHIAVFLAFIFVDLLQLFIQIEGAALYEPFSAPGEDLKAMLANVFLVHSLGVLDTLAFNGPSWSISVEFYTYILFALILIYTGRFYKYAVIFVMMASALLLFMNHDDLFAKIDYGFFRGVYGFGCGALTWELYQKFNEKCRPLLQGKLKSGIIETSVLVLCLIYVGLFSFDAISFFAPLVFGVVIFLFAFEAGIVSKALKHRMFLLLGALSYSIYMNHMFISGKLFALPVRLLENWTNWDMSVTIDGMKLYGNSVLAGTAWELFYLLIVICCSYISYKIIEEPFRKMAKRQVKKDKVLYKNDSALPEFIDKKETQNNIKGFL